MAPENTYLYNFFYLLLLFSKYLPIQHAQAAKI